MVCLAVCAEANVACLFWQPWLYWILSDNVETVDIRRNTRFWG